MTFVSFIVRALLPDSGLAYLDRSCPLTTCFCSVVDVALRFELSAAGWGLAIGCERQLDLQCKPTVRLTHVPLKDTEGQSGSWTPP